MEDVEMVERHVVVVDPATLKTYRQLKTKRKYVPAFEKGSPPKIEIETTLSELQMPTEEVKRTPATPPRNVAGRRKA